MRLIAVMLVSAVALGGCARLSESRVNPLNWFGGEREARAQQPQQVDPLVPQEKVVQTVDGRPLVASLSSMEITPTQGGILVRASGSAAQAGAFSAELTTASVSATEIVLDMRAFQGNGTGDGRVTVARFFTEGELGSARTITVRSASGSLSRRR